MLKLVNAFLKQHRKELGLKGYSKMSYLEKLNYLKEKTKGTKYEREIAKFTKPRVDEGIKKVLEKSGRGQNVRVKREKKVRPPKPEPKKKITTTQALQELPLDVGGLISQELDKKWEKRLDNFIKSAPKNYGNKKFMEIGLEGFKVVKRKFQKKGFQTKDLKLYLSKLDNDEDRLKVISAMEKEMERLVGKSKGKKEESLAEKKTDIKRAFDSKENIGLRIGKKRYWGKVISMDDKGFVIEGDIGDGVTRYTESAGNIDSYGGVDWTTKNGKKRISYTQIGVYGVMNSKPTF